MSENLKIELHVLFGLPGSGKTTFAKKEKENETSSRRIDIIDFDKVVKYFKDVYYKEESQIEKVRNMVFSYSSKNIWILDGLFLNQNDVEWVLSVYADSDYFMKHYDITKIVVHYWNEDRESCLWNDKGRRSKSAAMTIKNAEFFKPDIEKIEKRFEIETEMVEHTVERKSEYEVLTDNFYAELHDGKYIYSNGWCKGGERSDYDGNSYNMSVDAPCNFDLLDNILEELCPTITFLQYKKLYNACVTEDERYESDYYSSWTEGYYKCDIIKMFDMLKEMGVLTLDKVVENI